MLGGSRLVAFVGTVDLDRALDFYADRLGLRLVEQTEFACVFADAAGSATLRVTAAPVVVPAPYTVLGWAVDDLEATVGGLGERGVEFVRFGGLDQDALTIWSAPSGARVAWFRDPDANLLSVTESPPEPLWPPSPGTLRRLRRTDRVGIRRESDGRVI